MQINVAQLLKSDIGSVRELEVSGVVDITGGGAESNVGGYVRLLRTDRSILVSGTINTEVELTCSRCLAAFSCPLAFTIEEEYFPVVDVVSGAPLAVPGEPGSFTIDEHHILDLTEAVRQYALLVIPMKPLCREACSGLCPACGHNLNLGPCRCPPPPVDPRWAVLTKLNSKQKGTD